MHAYKSCHTKLLPFIQARSGRLEQGLDEGTRQYRARHRSDFYGFLVDRPIFQQNHLGVVQLDQVALEMLLHERALELQVELDVLKGFRIGNIKLRFFQKLLHGHRGIVSHAVRGRTIKDKKCAGRDRAPVVPGLSNRVYTVASMVTGRVLGELKVSFSIVNRSLEPSGKREKEMRKRVMVSIPLQPWVKFLSCHFHCLNGSSVGSMPVKAFKNDRGMGSHLSI
ncbi:unnamed protein product [Trypanosoma congolense IL3000]|uniref:WGS project CAEQ00000000 data, annotated contig 2143 n=1 Tax=Trypanosoma congolense (strain IL3000) TaxID=1068625 RepID=F9WBT1_TRYCI|nr:unnamed protein product [Trypanosoma congolense IL3000]